MTGFVTSLEERLTRSNSSVAFQSISLDLYKHIDSLSEDYVATGTDRRRLDEQGTRLWNLSVKFKDGDAPLSKQLICLCELLFYRSEPSLTLQVRVLSCLLLDCGHKSGTATVPSLRPVFSRMAQCSRFCRLSSSVKVHHQSCETLSRRVTPH